MAAPSFSELVALAVAEAISKRPDLAINEGDITDMLIHGGAAMADRAIGYTAERFAATFLDTASGDDLTTLCNDHWRIARQEADKATGTVTFTRGGADASAQSLPIGTVVATDRDSAGGQVRYLTTQAASWGISVNGTRTVNVEAEVGGLKANLPADSITKLISSPPAGGTYTVTDSSAMVGGSEAETDQELRDRTRGFTVTLGKGTLPAVEYGALTVSGVKKAKAIQDEDTGITTLYVTDASGLSSPAMVEAVDDEMVNWRAAGAVVNVVGGDVQTVDITISLTVRIGVDAANLAADVADAVEGVVNRLTIGETLYKSLIQAAARGVDPDNIVEVTVTSPPTDTAPTTSGHIIRAGTVTVG